MGGPIIIPKNPRRVVLDALAAVPKSDIADDDVEQFDECMRKQSWSPGEARFMQKHLPSNQRRTDWAEDE